MYDTDLAKIYDEMYEKREKRHRNRWDTPFFDEIIGIPWDEYTLACMIASEGAVAQEVAKTIGRSLKDGLLLEEIDSWVYYCARKAGRLLKKGRLGAVLESIYMPVYELLTCDNTSQIERVYFLFTELLGQISDEAVVLWDDFINRIDYSIPNNINFISLIISSIYIAELRFYVSCPYVDRLSAVHFVFQYIYLPDTNPGWRMILPVA